MSHTLEEIETWIGTALPAAYRAFLADREEELPVGELVLLYGRSDFVERNETYETKQYCPGFITVGDDSGGWQLLLSLSEGTVSLVDAGSMDPALAKAVAPDFSGWLGAGCPLPDEEDENM